MTCCEAEGYPGRGAATMDVPFWSDKSRKLSYEALCIMNPRW